MKSNFASKLVKNKTRAGSMSLLGDVCIRAVSPQKSVGVEEG